MLFNTIELYIVSLKMIRRAGNRVRSSSTLRIYFIDAMDHLVETIHPFVSVVVRHGDGTFIADDQPDVFNPRQEKPYRLLSSPTS